MLGRFVVALVGAIAKRSIEVTGGKQFGGNLAGETVGKIAEVANREGDGRVRRCFAQADQQVQRVGVEGAVAVVRANAVNLIELPGQTARKLEQAEFAAVCVGSSWCPCRHQDFENR